jgi:hypothetical protein
VNISTDLQRTFHSRRSRSPLNRPHEAPVVSEEEGDDSDTENQAGRPRGDEDHPFRPRQRLNLPQRKVNDLKSSLDERNYDPVNLPLQKREITAFLQKRTKNIPEQKITWKNFKSATAGRQARHNIIRTPGGVMGNARNASNPLECLELFFTPNIMDQIVLRSNTHIQRYLDQLSESQLEAVRQKSSWVRLITIEEFRAYIGIMYIRALLQQNYWNARRCFDEEIGHPIFTATMSLNRQGVSNLLV